MNTWQYPRSQADMPPYNRIRQVIEMDVKYEDCKGGSSREEEDFVEIRQAAMSEKTIV